MRIGVAQVDITPAPGGELSGFAARTQPAEGTLDPLFAKAICIQDQGQRLLWIHCDLIAFDTTAVTTFRRWAYEEMGLSAAEVMLSATHTHSGPATIHLREAGAYDEAYLANLHRQLHAVAIVAMARGEECSLVTAEGHLDLAVDRRGKPSRHTDPRVGGIGFRRPDGTFIAAILNYAIHPVALGSNNRRVSADLMGAAADALARQLPGQPMVLATNGACGNLNPPSLDVTPAQLETWGGQIADAIAPGLAQAPVVPSATFSTVTQLSVLPLDVLDPAGLTAAASAALHRGPTTGAWKQKYKGVVEHWRNSLNWAWQRGETRYEREAELFAINLGGMIYLGINAEVFSRFVDVVRRATGRPVFVVGYANGNLGYLATLEAYEEGGYEVDDAHFFYGGYRFKAGALEQLEADATKLVGKFPTVPSAPAH